MHKVANPQIAGIETYAVQGTPGDCVILGLQQLFRDSIDLVVSGINDGANLGNDVLISGTVGGAMQAYFSGVPAIAISTAPLEKGEVGTAARLAAVLAELIIDGTLPKPILLNVNLPDLPEHEIEGIEVTNLAKRTYVDVIEQSEDARGKVIYWITRGKAVWEHEDGTDIWAMRNKRVSITPLQSDIASREQVAQLASVLPALRSMLTIAD
jgi:5'-nucleotidase